MNSARLPPGRRLWEEQSGLAQERLVAGPLCHAVHICESADAASCTQWLATGIRVRQADLRGGLVFLQLY